MKKRMIAFIVIREYESLGIGYMAATLEKEGYTTKVIDFRMDKKVILTLLRKANPGIVGFSVVYQYHIDKFIELINYLRNEGINCHFTAGGHYASVRPAELFELIPSLDTIVRFEGEDTIKELAKNIYEGTGWENIASIVYKKNNNLIFNPLRPLESDLDNLPYPKRAPLPKYLFDKKFATILAGRGCIHDCSFCNLKEFYRFHRGTSKRTRNPEKVVAEMNYLYKKRDCSVFLFQDDDFPVSLKNKSEWIFRFSEELIKRKLNNRIIWKINCRPDEIDPQLFKILKSIGLFLVFLGIEDGTDAGLKNLNKHMSVQETIEGINILKRLKIGFDYGFLLFQPMTTFKTLHENLNFLRSICGDGYSPVTFLKLMPYYDTPVENELIRQGRIKGSHGYGDYGFIEESMNKYFDFITGSTLYWIRDTDGVANISKWARNFFLVHDHFYFYRTDIEPLQKRFNEIMTECNIFLLNSIVELAHFFESGNYLTGNKKFLNDYRETIKDRHEMYRMLITGIISELKLMSEAYKILSV